MKIEPRVVIRVTNTIIICLAGGYGKGCYKEFEDV